MPNLFLQTSSKKSCNFLIFCPILTNFLPKCRTQNVDSEKGHGDGEKGMALALEKRGMARRHIKMARGNTNCAVNRTQPCDVILSKTVTSCCHDLSATKKRQIFLSKYLSLIRPFRTAAVEQKVCQHNISNVPTSIVVGSRYPKFRLRLTKDFFYINVSRTE